MFVPLLAFCFLWVFLNSFSFFFFSLLLHFMWMLFVGVLVAACFCLHADFGEKELIFSSFALNALRCLDYWGQSRHFWENWPLGMNSLSHYVQFTLGITRINAWRHEVPSSLPWWFWCRLKKSGFAVTTCVDPSGSRARAATCQHQFKYWINKIRAKSFQEGRKRWRGRRGRVRGESLQL